MQIVLTKDVPHVGHKGEVKNVKDGYFRNFLAPRGKAIRLTPALKKQVETERAARIKKREEMIAKAEEWTKKIEKLTVTFKQKATARGKLYAAITEKQIQKELEKHLKVEFEKDSIVLPSAIKTVGSHVATVRLTETHSAEINIEVVGDSSKK